MINDKLTLNRYIKKGILLSFVMLVANASLFATIELPKTHKIITSIPDGGRWVYDDRTEFTKEKGRGFIEVPNPVINNVYLLNDKSLLQNSGENFVLLNECSGMDFAFSWSVVRILAIKETMNEVKKYVNEFRVGQNNGKSFRIIEEKRDSKTGEMYIRYSWKTEDNRLINGYMHGIYYQKNMLINLTMEWADNKGKQNAINAFKELKEQLDLKYDLKI